MKYTVTIRDASFEIELHGGQARIDGKETEATLHAVPGSPQRQLVLGGRTESFAMVRRDGVWEVQKGGETYLVSVVDERTRQLQAMTQAGAAGSSHAVVRAPMPGLVVRVEVGEGAIVRAGQGLVVLEAMKMENELTAPVAGRVSAVHVRAGHAVEKGTPLVEVSGEG
ncbi:MAG: biotin/lipoyl-binding protein [Gemmatimonadota bacterium]|nr:biotin/lipoyl-binding protein [Gemmatimonadota bacterium]